MTPDQQATINRVVALLKSAEGGSLPTADADWIAATCSQFRATGDSVLATFVAQVKDIANRESIRERSRSGAQLAQASWSRLADALST